MDNKTELLKKLKSLAESGVGGEKTNAEAMLKKLLDKYGIAEDELNEETLINVEFKFCGEKQKVLLAQIIYKVTNRTNNTYVLRYTKSKRLCRNTIAADVTAAQKIEIEFLFSFYVQQWEIEQNALLSAFIQKHRLFGVSSDDESDHKMSNEEIFKMCSLMKGLSDVSPVRRLNQNKYV